MKTTRSTALRRGILTLAALVLAAAALPAQAQGGLIKPADAKALLERDPKAVLIDVRTREEYASGYIKGAKLLPYDAITAQSAAAAAPDKQAPVVVYCRSGRRSAIAADSLRKLGYARVWDLGGVNTWPYGLEKAAGK